MAIAAQDLRSGTLFQESGRTYQVLEYHHHKMGRGKAVIKVKVRDVETGNVREITFNNNSSVSEVDAQRQNVEFVYMNERKGEVTFSDPNTKERIIVSLEKIGEGTVRYLTEGTTIQALIRANGEILTIELPMTVDLKVVETGPSDKGDTQGSARKPAKLESGLTVQVPMFIKIGDVVRVNTQSGEYKERVS